MPNVATQCQFCARDNGAIHELSWNIVALPKIADSRWDYWVAMGCLNELHVQTYVVCSRHLDIFRLGFGKIPCPDCPLIPNTEVSYMAAIEWRSVKEDEICG